MMRGGVQVPPGDHTERRGGTEALDLMRKMPFFQITRAEELKGKI